MKRRVWLIVGISGLIAAGVSVALFLVFSARSMTNDSVIALAKSGFSEWLIIEKIKSSRTDFDTSANELVKLKEAGVTETVIYTMLNPTEPKGSSPKTATVARKEAAATAAPVVARGRCEASTSGDQPWLSRGTKAMWYSTSETGQHVEMLYERGTINRKVIFMVNVTLLELTPLHANLRLGNRAVFWSCINPTDMPLVRFSQDEKGNERNTSLGRGFGLITQKTSISKEDIVPMEYEKTSGGLYKIRAKSSLERGEYGFVPQATGGHFAMGERVYSFGVD